MGRRSGTAGSVPPPGPPAATLAALRAKLTIIDAGWGCERRCGCLGGANGAFVSVSGSALGRHAGVFSPLRGLGPDAEVTIARQDDSAVVFRVTRVKEYPKDEFPTDVVYGDLDHAGLRLIVC